MAKITIINPRFEISFWGLEHCMPLFGKKANLPVANLALLAALAPKHHDVTLIDENVEDLDFDRVAEADLVCLTGMSIQGRRLIEIAEALKARGVTVVVGGGYGRTGDTRWPRRRDLCWGSRRNMASIFGGVGTGAATNADMSSRTRPTLPNCHCRASTC
jgi:hypothetical protein